MRHALTVVILMLLVGHPAKAASDDVFVFIVTDGTLEWTMDVDYWDQSCDGVPCPDEGTEECPASADSTHSQGPGFRLNSGAEGVLVRTVGENCRAEVQGTMTVTVYQDPQTGEPLPPDQGGVPTTTFPEGSLWRVPAVVDLAVSGFACSGSTVARLEIGDKVIEQSSGVDDPCTGYTESYGEDFLRDGRNIPVHGLALHSDSLTKKGLVGFGGVMWLTVPKNAVPVHVCTWSRLKVTF